MFLYVLLFFYFLLRGVLRKSAPRYPSPSGEDRNSERSYEFVNFLVRVELNLCPNGMNPLQLFLNSLRSLRNSVLSTLGEGKLSRLFRPT